MQTDSKNLVEEGQTTPGTPEGAATENLMGQDGIEVMTPDMAFDSPDVGIEIDRREPGVKLDRREPVEHFDIPDATEVEVEQIQVAPVEDLSQELSFEELVSAIESLLFVADRPLTTDRLKKVVGGIEGQKINAAIRQLQEDLSQDPKRGLFLAEIAGGYQLRTKEANANWIRNFSDTKPVRLGPAAMEVLSIIAYRQPITRAGVEEIRGVDCGQVVRTLLDRKLVKMIGKVEEPGRPLLYGTTKYFLEVFGIKSLNDLPPLKEFQEISAEESDRLKSFLGTQGDALSEENLLNDLAQIESE